MDKESFFQSSLFKELQEKIPYRGGWKVEGGGWSGVVVKVKLPFGFSWLWIPYGPLEATGNRQQGTGSGIIDFFREVGKIAKIERAIFCRIEPSMGWKGEWIDELRTVWHVEESNKRFTPQHTLVLDLTKSKEELLAEMKPKGRYNIAVAQRHNIEVRRLSHFEEISSAHFTQFYQLLKETSQRDAFGIHPDSFYRELLTIFCKNDAAALFLAFCEGRVVAGAIVMYYKNTATYYYGASSYHDRHYMAPYLVQWEAICEAKNRGFKYYDFLGISRSDRPDNSWYGITQFKKKFGGQEVSYPKAFSIIYRPLSVLLFKLKSML